MADVKFATIETFAKKQLKLLDLERNAEIEESVTLRRSGDIKELEKRGICVSKLSIVNECTGLYGKHLVTFVRSVAGNTKSSKEKAESFQKDQLSSHCFSNGDIVGLQTSSSPLNDDNIGSGIVTKAAENKITVAFEDALGVTNYYETFKLIKLCNDVTYQRLKKALGNLQDTKKSSHLKDALFHLVPLGNPLSLVKDDTFHLFDTALNSCQADAVKFALNQKEVAVIHGPPGTGKTTTVIEIIKQATLKFNLKVLACAPSNVAVDNLVAKLADSKIKIIRLGHPARVYPHLQRFSLDAVLMRSDSAEIIRNVRNDIQKAQGKLKESKNGDEKRKLRAELKYLKKELFEREDKAIKSVLSSADVILSTTTSSYEQGPLRHLNEDHFDLIIIDEAAQALEASCWIPLSFGSRCILAGDHNQLPPTIISQEASKKGLEVTLMERIVKEFGPGVVRMLTTQYRMNNYIMSWPSKQLYDNKLTADDSVASHLLCELPGVISDENTSVPLVFFDTAGCCMYEMKKETEESKGNESEVDLVDNHVTALINAKVKPDVIGVITPYNLQVELLRRRLSFRYPKLEIRSVDGFQGREKEAIVISLVRSNDDGEVGFLKEDRRLNVAITRARRHLAVIGDSQTISNHPFLKSFYEYVADNGEVRSVQTFLNKEDDLGKDKADDLLKDFENLRHGRNHLGAEAITKNVSVKNECVSSKTLSVVNKSTNVSITEKVDRESNAKISHERREDEVNVEDVKFSKKDIEEKVSQFLESEAEEVLTFDSLLDGKGRFWVHELAEKFGLAHWSSGTGEDRCISVKRKTKKARKEEANSLEGGPSNHDCYLCEICGKLVPSKNKELHIVRCEKNMASEVKIKPSEGKSKAKETGKSKRKGADKRKEEEDVDDLIAKFTQDDSKCYFDQCKASVLTLGQKCKFCTRTFCLKHGLAEVHGCGQAAKIDARRSSDKAMMKQKTKPLNDIQRNYAKKKLSKKLDEFEKQRSGNKEKKK
ncbi:DNA-binding protein SMUBP-2-like [Rhopilema esculentum]|uniref:DNA-binding protein SMUBP-2-like n=1 Tax=Rhopilema esculentum TaxID=499914 RepID=UPI0031DE58FD|eukprot:gene12806-3545_t